MSVHEKYFIDIEKMKPQLLEAFSAVYGEKYRDVIAERLETIHVNTYITAKHFSNFMLSMQNREKRKITTEFLEDLGYTLTDEEKSVIASGSGYKLTDNKKDILTVCFGNNEYQSNKFADINAFFEEETDDMSDYRRKTFNEKKVRVLNALGANVTLEGYKEAISNGSIDDILSKLEIVKSKIAQANEKYAKFEEEHKEELDEVKRCETIKRELDIKTSFEYLDEISELLPEEEKAKIIEAKSSRYFNYVSEYFNYSINTDPLIASFSSKSEDKLLNGKDYEKENIINNRIKLFKEKGIDLGNDYEAYMKSDEAKSIVPNTEFADKICEIKRKHEINFRDEFFKQTGSYQDNKRKLDELGLLEEDGYNAEFAGCGTICLSTNMVNDNDKYKPKLVLHIPLFNLINKYKDIYFVHEVGHAIELELLQKDEDFVYKTGFEYVPSDLNKESIREDKSVKRKTEIMSEVIHQRLAMEVTNYLHNKGNFLLGESKAQEIFGATSYEVNYPVLKEFYEQHRDDIIEARMSDDGFKRFDEKIPEDFFDKLNNLVTEHNNLPLINIVFAKIDGRETKDTLNQKDIIARKDELMKKYGNDELLKSAIEATEEVTRTGIINEKVKGITDISVVAKEDFREEV